MPTIGTQLNVMIDPDKRDRFKNKVRGEGKTINEVVNELIDAYLANTNLPNQANQYELEEAIANSKKFQELTTALENHDTTLDLLSRMIEEIKNKLDNETTPSDSSNNQVNQEDKGEVTLISSEGEEIVTPEKMPSENALEATSNENQDTNIIEEDKPVVEAKYEDVPESEEDKNPEMHSQQEIKDDEVKAVKRKKQGKPAKTRLTQEELDHAISVKDLDTLLDLTLTGKEGKRELIKNLIKTNEWIKERFVELEKKHPPKRRINGQKQSFNYSHLKTYQADEIIKEFCQR